MEKITELVEKAAQNIALLEPENTEDLKELQNIIKQINESFDSFKDLPEELLKSAESANKQAMDEIENILQKQVKDSDKSIQVISASIELIQEMTKNIQPGKSEQKVSDTVEEKPEDEGTVIAEEDIPLIQDFITESEEHLETAESSLLELENSPGDDELLNQIFRAFHTIKGMAGFMNLNDINELAHSSENLLDLGRKKEVTITGNNSDIVFESIDLMKEMMTDLTEAIDSGKAAKTPESFAPLLTKVKSAVENGSKNSDKSDEAEESSEKKDTEKKEAKSDNPEVDRRSGEDRRKEDKGPPNGIERRSGKDRRASAEEKIKVNTSKLDNLVNMAGELVIAQLMVSEEIKNDVNQSHDLARKIAHQGKIVRELQEISMSMRMVPIQGVFQKMARLSRDLSRKANKEIDFNTEGEETELDRSLVDKIADPLVHMVRNSIDHGLETPEERKKAGKSEKGTIELKAFHKAGNIIIEIRDDGRGLDRDKILAKAVDNGLVSKNQDLSDEEVYNLIFHPGLSTAKKVTEISGRGVGMDVVKKNIEALRGKVHIASTPGEGSVFSISLPLTLAVIDGQIVRIGQEKYIIPINTIDKSIRPEKQQLSSVQNKGEIINERGELIPLVRLYDIFGVKPDNEDPAKSSVVIVENDKRKCCLLVDELLGQQQVVIKNLGETLGKIEGISGGAIMGDGKVRLILDVPGLIKLSQR